MPPCPLVSRHIPSPAPARRRSLVLLVLTALLTTGCWSNRDKLPGDTKYRIRNVTFEGASFEPGDPLRRKIGFRPDGLLFPGHDYNPYREGEDRRRIIAFWQTKGFFDIQVEGPWVKKDEEAKMADVRWKLTEGPKYKIGSVQVVNAPKDLQEGLDDLVPFEVGDDIELEVYRLARVELADYVRYRGYAHTEVYSRTFIDTDKKVVHWYYYVDAGPKTRVGKVSVTGNVAIPKDVILRRIGLKTGDPFDKKIQLKREADLYDTGAFAVVKMKTTADVEFLIGKLPPDTGGTMRPDMVAEDGTFIGRQTLSPDIDIVINVVEASSTQVRAGLGGQAELTRLDAYARGNFLFRNLFGPLHHLTIDLKAGYGWLFRASNDEPLGVYGHGEIRYDYAGLIARLLDFRIFGRMDERLFPGFHTRKVTAGMGFRTAISRQLFLDIVPQFRWEQPIAYLDDGVALNASDMMLTNDTMYGFELAAAIVWDARDNRVEALKGHLLKASLEFGPGGPLSTHRYLKLDADVRGFVPIAQYISIGMRAKGSWVLLGEEDKGVPAGVRLFGGGAYGSRVFNTHALTAFSDICKTSQSGDQVCESQGMGALSLVEASLELRWLPFRQQLGAVGFVDLGAAGGGANPFENGVDVSVGVGARVRLWYLPMALDIAVRVTEEPGQNEFLDRLLVFFRLGEAF